MYSHEGTHVTRLAEDFVGTISLDGQEKQPWFFATLNGFMNPCTVACYDFAALEDQRWNIFVGQPNSRDSTPMTLKLVRSASSIYNLNFLTRVAL